MSAIINIHISGKPIEVMEALDRLSRGVYRVTSVDQRVTAEGIVVGTAVEGGNGKDHAPEAEPVAAPAAEQAEKPKDKKGRFVKQPKPAPEQTEDKQAEDKAAPDSPADIYVTAIRSLQDAYGTPKGTEAVAKLREIFNVKKFAEIAKDKHQEFYDKVQELLA